MCSFTEIIESHLNPVNAAAHLVAFVVLAYGLWQHDLTIAGAGIVVGLAGHAYVYLTGWKYAPKKR